MNAYLLGSDSSPLDESVAEGLQEKGVHSEALELPDDHEEVTQILADKQAGAVFLPPAWVDLFSIKIINEIENLSTPFETVITGPPPDLPDLIAAFNNGLSAFLEVPFTDDKLDLVITRLKNRLRKQVEQRKIESRLAAHESGGILPSLSPQIVERDQLLATAIKDLLNGTGPLLSGDVNILLVSSSTAQQKRMEKFLNNISIQVTQAGDMSHAMESIKKNDYNLIICDSMLPDGDALTLAQNLRKALKSNLPRFIVWSSSPEKASELLRPENHIDDVIMKPGPGVGIEYVLPSILAGIYQTR